MTPTLVSPSMTYFEVGHAGSLSPHLIRADLGATVYQIVAEPLDLRERFGLRASDIHARRNHGEELRQFFTVSVVGTNSSMVCACLSSRAVYPIFGVPRSRAKICIGPG